MANNQTQYDVIIVGSGINSLVCASLAAKKGKKVLLVEKENSFGGCIKSAEIFEKGVVHDLLSSWHPLFITSPAYAILKDDLEKHGLQYCMSEVATASIDSECRVSIIGTNREANIKELDKSNNGEAYKNAVEYIEQHAQLIFYLFGNQLWRFSTFKFLLKYGYKNRKLLFSFITSALLSAESWVKNEKITAEFENILAPWILHTGSTPSATLSALMSKLILFTLEAVGMPVVKGGSSKLVDAFIALLKEKGATCLNESEVKKVLVENNKAIGVELSNSNQYFAKQIVCNTTPAQLYQRFLNQPEYSQNQEKETKSNNQSSYRFGKAGMQIHIILNGQPKWIDKRLASVPLVHLCDGVFSINQACNEASHGFLPSNPTVVVGQPLAVDSSRSNGTHSILWLQLLELPSKIKADSKGEINTGSGEWNDEIKNQYANRIIEKLQKYITNWDEIYQDMLVLGPQDLEKLNINLEGGDPYSGDCILDQFFLFRPSYKTLNHKTSVENLYHIGASTHPGPGLAGTSGFLVAKNYL